MGGKSKIKAMEALCRFKSELAGELGLNQQYKRGYWSNIPCREYGPQDINLMRGLLAAAEKDLLAENNFSEAFSGP